MREKDLASPVAKSFQTVNLTGWLEEDSFRKRNQIHKESGREEPELVDLVSWTRLSSSTHCI